MTKPFCNAVRHGLAITAYGAVNPCCASLDFTHISNIDNIVDYVRNDADLKTKQLIEDTDEWLYECLGCKDKQDKGLVSRKDKYLKWFPLNDNEWSLNNPNAILHMDIIFGNTCSQQCIMCNSNFSSKWLAADVNLYDDLLKAGSLIDDKSDDRKYARHFNKMTLKNWSLSYEQLDQIASLVTSDTRKIEIKGGEPLYDKRFSYFVGKCLEQNPKVQIATNTNGMHFNKKTIDMLNKIEKLNIDISFDGTGKVFEWIRSDNWDKAVKNFENCLENLNHPVNLNYTTMMYNVDHFETFYNWAADMSDKYQQGIPMALTQVVNSPRHIGPAFASKDKLKAGIGQLERIKSDPRNIDANKNNTFEPRAEILIAFLQKCYDEKHSDRDLERHAEVHKWFTNVRGWDIHANM